MFRCVVGREAKEGSPEWVFRFGTWSKVTWLPLPSYLLTAETNLLMAPVNPTVKQEGCGDTMLEADTTLSKLEFQF